MAEPLVPDLGDVPFPRYALKGMVYDKGEIKSPSQRDAIWTYGELRAKCMAYYPNPSQTEITTKEHLASCSCGIYGVFALMDVHGYIYNAGSVLVGIETSGLVVESTRGVRCTHARISHVILPSSFMGEEGTERYGYYHSSPTTETAEEMAEQYGLPIVTLDQFLSETGIAEWRWRQNLAEHLERLPRVWHDAVLGTMRKQAQDVNSAAYKALEMEFRTTLRMLLGKKGGQRVRQNIG